MTQFQRGQAIDILLDQTDVLEAEIEQHDDMALEAWLYELGYDGTQMNRRGCSLPITTN